MKGTTALLTAALSLLGAAMAAGTTQGTAITNTATLTYKDALNQNRTASSNIVTVTVRQVYVTTVTPDAAEGSIPAGRQLSTYVGGTRQYPYTLTNGGNGPDSFTLSFTQSGADDFNPGLKVYRDLDGDGTFSDEVTAPISLAADASVNLMVRATVPSGPQVGNTGIFALVATSTGDTSVTDTNNYAQLTVSADGLLGVTNTVSPGGTAVPGATLTYTVTGTVASGNPVGAVSNVVTVDGAARSGVLITDTLTNLNFTALSSVTATNGTATALYSTDAGSTWSATNPGSGVNAVAILVEGSGSFLLAGNTVQLVYTAQVPATALAGSTVGGSASARFDGNGDAATNELPETTTPVAVSTTVATVTGGAVGPSAFPQAGATGTYTLGGVTIARSGDTQTTQTDIVAGTRVTFRQTLRNTGNASNDFTLAVSGAPSGWTCTVNTIDGSGTLGTLTNPVTVAPLTDYTFAVSCAVPFSAAGSTNVALTVTATPAGGSADTTTSTVATITAAGLPQLGNGDGSDATAPTSTNVTAGGDPGGNALFRLELLNGGPVDEAFTLSGPAGTVFYLDLDGDGVIDPGEPPVTTTAALTPGQSVNLIAAVPVAAGSATGTSPAVFTATSTLDATRTSSVTDTLRVNAVASGTFTADSSLSTIAGGTVTHAHTLTNTGNGAADYAAGPLPTTGGFAYAFSTSPSGPFTSTLGGTLAAGASTPVYVRVTAPTLASGATDSQTKTVPVTLTMQDAPQPAVTLSVQDTTGVQSVVGTVNKSALRCADATCAVTSAITDGKVSPGDIVQYTLQVVNSGTSTLYGALLSDTRPTSTTFVKLTGGTSILFSTDSGATWTAAPPTALSGGNDFLAGLDTNGDSVINDLDTLAPGAGFTVTFVVRIN
ncbi:beta strand repeat-containing protein [Deinococcus soli (ex Cha et al. 2016)]|uniref:beta strand repeat-containing protein n=1 Tax=Deinococcus soli (ex Cha et al. 2016) TaxID=1309411 RepID=UPI00166C12CC|nr:DUF11 domain-containing protein [Deinococcus soli (ex Cha et al. 2016)]GGB54692.1 hypothetical protein GCM10008019_08000 [Deinococcus soli (ex Cha et al. 2016)]